MARRLIFPELPDILTIKDDRRERSGRRAATWTNPCDVLSVYYRGGPRYRIGRNTYAFEAPAALLVPRGVRDWDLQTGSIAGIFVMFHGHGLVRKAPGDSRKALLAFGDQRFVVPFLVPLRSREGERLAALLREMAAARAGGGVGHLRAASLLLQALAEYAAAARPENTTDAHRAAWRLRGLIDAQAYADAPMAGLYDSLEVSAAHAATLFKAAFHVTPVAYRLGLRLQKARELLASSTLNVGQVARSVGFSDPLYFSRLFHRAFGMVPSELVRGFRGYRRRP